MMNRFSLLIIAMLSYTWTLFGIPARPGVHPLVQPNGELLFLEKIGDENFSCYLSEEGFPVLLGEDKYYYYAQLNPSGELIPSSQRVNPKTQFNDIALLSLVRFTRAEALGLIEKSRLKAKGNRTNSPHRIGGYPTTGEVTGLVLLVEFDDVRFVTLEPQKRFDLVVNEKNYAEGGFTGSVCDYFNDQSQGLFTPKFDVIGPITLSNNMAVYGGNIRNSDKDAPRMIVEACVLAEENLNTDFSKYDINKDGVVDLVYVIYAGFAESQSRDPNTIWPHAWDVRADRYDVNIDGITLGPYACSSELAGSSGQELDGIGTICHEFTHCLGLPDFYDTSGGNNFGFGSWDIMDIGSYNGNSRTPAGYSAYERDFLGWMQITDLDTIAREVTLQGLESGLQAYRIYNPQNRNEYFIFENRQPTKWDAKLPTSGLMISHYDYNSSKWWSNRVNATPNDKGATIIPADCTYGVGQDYYFSLKGDLYPGKTNNREFSNTSTPVAQFKTGNLCMQPLCNIRQTNDLIVFDYLDGIVYTPSNISAESPNGNEIQISWAEMPQSQFYQVQYQIINQATNSPVSKSENGWTLTDSIYDTQHTITGLALNTDYALQVRAVGSRVHSDWSAPIFITTPNTTALQSLSEQPLHYYSSAGKLIIETPQGGSLQLLDMTGKPLYRFANSNHEVMYLNPGIYLIIYQEKTYKVAHH